jgi:hypothetical protein
MRNFDRVWMGRMVCNGSKATKSRQGHPSICFSIAPKPDISPYQHRDSDACNSASRDVVRILEDIGAKQTFGLPVAWDETGARDPKQSKTRRQTRSKSCGAAGYRSIVGVLT